MLHQRKAGVDAVASANRLIGGGHGFGRGVVERIAQPKAARRTKPRPKKAQQRGDIGLRAHPRPHIIAGARRRPARVARLMPARTRHNRGGKSRRDFRLAPQCQRKQHIVKGLHVAFLPICVDIEMDKAVADYLRQCPDERARDTTRARRIGGGIDRLPLPGLIGAEHETAQIMLRAWRIAKPLGGGCRPARAAAGIARGYPVIILELQHIKGWRRPAKGQVHPRYLWRCGVEQAGEIGEHQRFAVGRTRPDCGGQRGR